MEDVLKSSIGISTEGYLHQLHFFYPVEGGYESLVHAFAAKVRGEIRTNWRVAAVARDGKRWRVTSADGEERTYDTLVSTLPIHELSKGMERRAGGGPRARGEAALQLADQHPRRLQ